MINFFKLKRQKPLQADLHIPLTEACYVIVDTELTGLHERKDSIISLGAVKMKGPRIELGATFHRLVKPKTVFRPESVIVHGITPSDVEEHPCIDTVIEDFLNFIGNDVIVGHYIAIDLHFINREMGRILGRSLENLSLDTFQLLEWLKTKRLSGRCFSLALKDSSLYEIAKCFEIPVIGAHDALVDAFITAQLFQRFIPHLMDAGIKYLQDLIPLGKPFEGGDAFRASGEISNF